MEKVKQIFKSDSHDSTTAANHGTTSHGTATHGTTTHGTATHGTTGTTHTTGTTGTSGLASKLPSNTATTGDHAHQEEHPTLAGHTHNIREHASLDGPGEKTHDHKHLAAVTKEKHHTHETEEVERIREHDRHVHHVQHHVQPVLDEKHLDREHKEQNVPVTHIHEQHVNTDEDRKLFAGHNQHHDEQVSAGTDRTVVDRGEKVNENITHHTHHVVQPVIERDTHHHKTIHTTIPIKQTTHEAPIIHQSSTHEPMHMKDFVAQGGDLKSKLTHDNAGVLAQGECARDVEGPAEKLAEKLHLGSGSHHTGATGTTGTAGTTGTTGSHHSATTGTTGSHHAGTTGTAGMTGTTSGKDQFGHVENSPR